MINLLEKKVNPCQSSVGTGIILPGFSTKSVYGTCTMYRSLHKKLGRSRKSSKRNQRLKSIAYRIQMWVEYLKTTTKHTEKQNQNNRCLDILLGTEFLLSTPMTSITVYMLKSPISWWHSHLSPRHMCSLPWQLQVGIHRHLKCNFVKVKLILPQIYAFFRVVSSEKKNYSPNC